MQQFLEANWLKPFDAVWDASVASVLATIPIREPSVDIGCGDGLFMLIAGGGSLQPTYDRYTDTHLRLRGDLYDVQASMTSVAAMPPTRPVTVGLDRKAGLLDKAHRTQTYRHLVQGDGQALPFPDGTFASVFSNILHWLPDWRAGLAEMRRVVKDDGRVVLVVPNRHVGKHLLSYRRARWFQRTGRTVTAAFFDWIDNGRFRTITRLTGDLDEWSHRLAEAGLVVCAGYPVLDGDTVTRWDFSTRPFLHLLVLVGRGLQALRLKAPVKRLVVRALRRCMSAWVERSLASPEASCGVWVLVAEPVRVVDDNATRGSQSPYEGMVAR